MSRRREVYLKVRLTVEERRRLTELGRQWGCKTSAEFVRVSLTKNGELTEALHNQEKRLAGTLVAMRTEMARMLRSEYVLFAMLENLAKIILTHLPPLRTENRSATIAFGKAAYERYLKAVGISLHNDAKIALDDLAALDEGGAAH